MEGRLAEVYEQASENCKKMSEAEMDYKQIDECFNPYGMVCSDIGCDKLFWTRNFLS